MLRLILAALLISYTAAFPDAEPDARRRQRQGGKTIHVKSPAKIQDAIVSAPRGSRIVVAKGHYAEQLTIKTDGLTLVGEEGATLVPPDSPVENECTGFAGRVNNTDTQTQAGICVTGSGLDLDEFVVEHQQVNSVRRPVKGVTISGFTVTGFSGFNILVIGAENTDIHDNTLLEGPAYGFLTAGSRDTIVRNNVINTSFGGFIGLCMDNFSKVKVTGNKISVYVIGLCIQTNGAEIENNEVSDGCYGAFLDPGVKDVRIRNNHFFRPFPVGCAGIGSAGISIDGAIGARVERNRVENWTTTDEPKTAGIAIVDDPCTNPSLSCLAQGGGTQVARNNRVEMNTVTDSTLDIFVATTGTGNEIRRNDCGTSNVEGVCRETVDGA